jgi:hypothetical protein
MYDDYQRTLARWLSATRRDKSDLHERMNRAGLALRARLVIADRDAQIVATAERLAAAVTTADAWLIAGNDAVDPVLINEYLTTRQQLCNQVQAKRVAAVGEAVAIEHLSNIVAFTLDGFKAIRAIEAKG